MELLISIMEQSFLFGLTAMGVYITYKILDFPDLTVDGSYPLGACVCAALLVNGINAVVAILIAVLAGALAGLVTAFLHVKLKISNLMSGILVMMALYSINLTVMGKSNTPLFNTSSVFDINIKPVFLIFVVLIIFKLLQDLFMKTQIGFLLLVVGDNEQVITTLGVNKGYIKIIGLMISNALVALSGALTAQYQGYADVGCGTGVVVKALACVIIGCSLFGKLKNIKGTTQAIIGTIIYYTAITLALKLGLSPNLLNLLTSVVIVIALCFEGGIFNKKNKVRKEKVNAESSRDIKNL